MRIDLQDIYRANPKAFIAASAVIAAAFAFLVVKGVSSGGSSPAKGQPAARVTTTTTSSSSSSTVASNGVTTPNPSYHPAYVTNVPSTAIDQQLASEYGAGGSGTAELESVTPAAPAWTTDYPAISHTQDEQVYATAFLEDLLDRNYARQSRSDLARWVSAESAGEMFPGVPAQAGDHALYAELMEPGVVGAPFTLVPTAAGWAADAKAGVVQRAYELFANPDANWSGLVSKGFTSVDPLMGAEDVTGVLQTTVHGKSTTQHFSAELMLGSALHHPGFGAWGIAQWTVS